MISSRTNSNYPFKAVLSGLEHGNLTYTVVLGEVLGNWKAEKPSKGAF